MRQAWTREGLAKFSGVKSRKHARVAKEERAIQYLTAEKHKASLNRKDLQNLGQRREAKTWQSRKEETIQYLTAEKYEASLDQEANLAKEAKLPAKKKRAIQYLTAEKHKASPDEGGEPKFSGGKSQNMLGPQRRESHPIFNGRKNIRRARTRKGLPEFSGGKIRFPRKGHLSAFSSPQSKKSRC
ncbi:MAG: hypothetical protein ACLTDS_14115 [Bianqueaceae bacterium]